MTADGVLIHTDCRTAMKGLWCPKCRLHPDSQSTEFAIREPDYSDPKVQSDISFRYRMHGDPEYNRLRHGLREIARKGCERLVDPSTCRQEKGGYPREEWCDGCIAAEALDMPRDWFVMHS